ncbi:sulfurtransferase [Herbaspirillum sp. RTI4]|uniref:sulfurtransferase n=1 Tax=Herbaspirillum sp. RTI4 TaxID=3048640 RepID=UPI002AB59FCA|nr:sulfurtransferase [Herbaspirillum sp. RTI4]MDY7577952.1 sulfurtransferase [Herbaspirillum sp. RTI4]MEA9981602.1 sulfurtransferase [Herbaspirillum sp. RTI4]
MSYTTLISASNLLQHYQQPGYVVIDCRHDLAQADAGLLAFTAGHIPGARFASMDRDLSGPKHAADGRFLGRHPLPTPADLLNTLQNLGIQSDSQVVAYDAHGGMFAARLWWLLRWIGHAQVAVLDGGLQAWQALEGPLLSGPPLLPENPGNLALADSLTRTVNAEQVLASLGQPSQIIIDARAPDRFRGENETMDPVGGHIPGAGNRFFKDNLLPEGRFKPGAQLRADFEPLIGNAPQNSVMQCGSGVTACHNLLALEIAGLHGAALYGGSWSEWCADPARPVATGA